MKLRYRFTKVFEFLERCLSKSMENTVQFGSGKRRQVRTLHSDFCIFHRAIPRSWNHFSAKKCSFFKCQFSWFINKKKSKQCDGLANLKWKAYLTKGLGQHKESQRYGDQIPENPQRSAGMGNPQAAMAICCIFGWDRCYLLWNSVRLLVWNSKKDLHRLQWKRIFPTQTMHYDKGNPWKLP